MKTKLFIGALTAALIIGAPITISVHRNAAKAIDAPQTSQLVPNVNETPKAVDIAPAQVNEKPSDITTEPAPVNQPTPEQTPAVSTPVVTTQTCTKETPVDTMCITAEGHLGRAVGQSANGYYMVVVNQSDNPDATFPEGFNYMIEIIGQIE
jgi:hypothetical protein